MRIRIALIALTVAGLAGCAGVTEPMACDGNPKCKADTQPSLPKLQLQPGAQVSGRLAPPPALRRGR